MEKDEEDEVGDHGSIVAFRIPCHPSVDFRPLPLRLLLQLLQPTCTPCNSPPPFVPSTISPLSLSCYSVSRPYSPLPFLLLAPSCDSHEALNRRLPSRTCIVVVHASLRRPRPRQTPNSLLSSLPSLHFLSSLLNSRSSPRIVLLPLSHAAFSPFSPPLPLSLSLCLSLLSQPPRHDVGGRSSRGAE